MVRDVRHGILWRLFVIVSWCLLGMACSDDAVPGVVAPAEDHSARVAQPDEAALRASVARAMQRDASAAYAAVDEGLGRYSLANSAKRLTATVDRAGLLVRANESAASFSLRTSAYGCEGAMREVGEREPSAKRNRVSYVAIDGDTAVVGAYGDDILAGGILNASQGSAYVFVRSGTMDRAT